ncbi:RNA chaperone Hfq [Enterococcus cecorum]|nr:RNA chaperone Hfq [Enterococcus cecorum]
MIRTRKEEDLLGKKVTIVFLNGKAITGKVTYVTRYQIYLSHDGDREFMIFKQGINYIALDS